MKCKFELAYRGPCGKPLPCDHGECQECKKPATRECDWCGQGWCGRLLCEDCYCGHTFAWGEIHKRGGAAS